MTEHHHHFVQPGEAHGWHHIGGGEHPGGALGHVHHAPDRQPLGEEPRTTGSEEEIANACAFLVSDYSGYVTGDVVTVDGGAWLEQGMFGA